MNPIQYADTDIDDAFYAKKSDDKWHDLLLAPVLENLDKVKKTDKNASPELTLEELARQQATGDAPPSAATATGDAPPTAATATDDAPPSAATATGDAPPSTLKFKPNIDLQDGKSRFTSSVWDLSSIG